MNAFNPANSAYTRAQSPSRSQRGLEYEILARVTQRLRNGWVQRHEDFPGLAQALADNQRLWSTLASDVASDGNGLPQKLRAQLFYLYEFTAQHSQKILAGTANAEVLIDINTAVLRGLRGATAGAAAGGRE